MKTLIIDEISRGGTPERISSRICDEIRRIYGGRRHYIPSLKIESRDAEIMKARESGATIKEIACAIGCHPSTVSRAITKKNNVGFGSEDWVL